MRHIRTQNMTLFSDVLGTEKGVPGWRGCRAEANRPHMELGPPRGKGQRPEPQGPVWAEREEP